VYGGADRRHQAAAGNAAVAHLPAMRWGWGIVVCRQGRGGPAYPPAFGRLYLLVQSVRAYVQHLPGMVRSRWLEATPVPQMDWGGCGEDFLGDFSKKILWVTHYETVQAGLFLRPCRHPPPGSPPGGHSFFEAYAQAQPRMLLPTLPLRIRGGCG
jgi:hypothetical protein